MPGADVLIFVYLLAQAARSQQPASQQKSEIEQLLLCHRQANGACERFLLDVVSFVPTPAFSHLCVLNQYSSIWSSNRQT